MNVNCDIILNIITCDSQEFKMWIVRRESYSLRYSGAMKLIYIILTVNWEGLLKKQKKIGRRQNVSCLW